jgi:hypothetical protein
MIGRPIEAIYGKYAVGGAPEGSTGFNPRLFARAIRMVLRWRAKIGGRNIQATPRSERDDQKRKHVAR